MATTGLSTQPLRKQNEISRLRYALDSPGLASVVQYPHVEV